MADEIVRGIFQLEVDHAEASKSLAEYAGQYAKTTAEADKQLKKLQELQAKEKQLQDARAKSNNPTVIVKYNNELAKVKKEMDALTVSEKNLGAATKSLGNEISNAFKATQVNGFSNEIKKLNEGFTETSAKTKSIKAQLRELKTQLAATDDDKEFLRLSIEAGKLEDRIGDAADAARIFATDSPFESVGRALGGVASKLASLDFAGAAQTSQLLVKATSQITFSQALAGIKQLGSTLINLGKALLTNPIFLLGAAIVFIIAKFDDLKNSGGIIGKVFSFIGDAVKQCVDLFFQLTDAIGLTNDAFDKFIKASLDGLQKLLERQNKLKTAAIDILKALGKETEKAEKEQLEFTKKRIKEQIALLEFAKGMNGKLTEDQVKQEEELKDKYLDTIINIEKLEAASFKKRADASKKYGEDRAKIFDELDKRLRAEQAKTSEFNIKMGNQNDSIKQITQTFELRKKIENDLQKELEKNTLKELKSRKDIATAKEKLAAISAQVEINRNNDKNEAILNANLANAQREIDARKLQDDELLNQFASTIDQAIIGESQLAEKRLDIQRKFYNDSIDLLKADIAARKAAGFDVTDQEKALAKLRTEAITKQAQAEKEIRDKKLDEEQRLIDKEEAHSQSQLKLQNARNSTLLDSEADFERQRLELLKENGKEFTDEYAKQQDKVLELEKEAKKQRILENISYVETITSAAIDATNKIIDTKIKEIDKLSDLQSQRVEDARAIAEKGNAEILELEQERLDDLNEQKAKFVRQQQALATLELIANSAIAISKAAAQGGAAAGFTIAATLIALTAGLVQARQLASSAAFYKGGLFDGEGYTGDGSPTSESTKVGRKPYTYHMQEFIFNHDKTRKNRDIFQGVHDGRIDLREWEMKAMAFDKLKGNYFNMGNPVVINNVGQENNRMNNLENLMEEMIKAINGQERVNIKVGMDGFTSSIIKRIDRQNFIKQLSK